MAKLENYADSKQYENTGNLDAFNLADDGDSDKVQFLTSSLDDVLTYTVHAIPLTNQKGIKYQRKVGCLKQHKDDPQGVCPLCDAGYKINLARFIPLYSHSQQKVMLWERGSQFIERNLGGFITRMNSQGVDVKNKVVEVVRQGRKGDQSTTYAIYPMDNIAPVDASSMEIPDPEGSWVASWNPAEMNNFNATGQIPQNAANNPNEGVQRRERTGSENMTQPGSASAPYNPENMTPVSSPEDMF